MGPRCVCIGKTKVAFRAPPDYVGAAFVHEPEHHSLIVSFDDANPSSQILTPRSHGSRHKREREVTRRPGYVARDWALIDAQLQQDATDAHAIARANNPRRVRGDPDVSDERSVGASLIDQQEISAATDETACRWLTPGSGNRTSEPAPRPITTRCIPSNVRRVSLPPSERTITVIAMSSASQAARRTLDPGDHVLCRVATEVTAELLDARRRRDIDFSQPLADEVEADEDETIGLESAAPCRPRRRAPAA